jgi:hypothetical protein
MLCEVVKRSCCLIPKVSVEIAESDELVCSFLRELRIGSQPTEQFFRFFFELRGSIEMLCFAGVCSVM